MLSWQNGIKAALIFAIFEGAFRKWIAPGSSTYIYFVKDILLLASYVGALADGRRIQVSPSSTMLVALVSSFLIVFLQAFNPLNGSLLIGLLGLKCYLIYVPLIFFGPSVFKNSKELVGFLKLFCFTALPIGLLGVLQYRASPESPLNAYAQEAAEWGVATFGDEVKRARITGTFSYIAGLTTYLYIIFSLCLVFLVIKISYFQRFLVYSILVLCVANMAMSGSRSNFVYIGIMIVASGFMMSGSGAQNGMKFLKIGLIVGVAGSLSKFMFSDAAKTFTSRARGDDSLLERLKIIYEPITNISEFEFFGFGVGTTHPARSQISEMFKIPPATFLPAGAEVEPLQVIQEMGPIGFIVWTSLKIVIFVELYRVTARLHSPLLKMLGITALSFHLAHFYLSTVANHIAGLYYWFLASFIFLLPRLQAIELRYRRRATRRVTPKKFNMLKVEKHLGNGNEALEAAFDDQVGEGVSIGSNQLK